MDGLKRLSASVQARVVQPATLRHYAWTKYGRALAGWRGRYAGRRCFLIGNGPSLRAEDLTVLHRHGEVSFGFNRVYHIFDSTPWRPDFYLSQDEKMLLGCREAVDELTLPVKLIPIERKWYQGIDIHDALYFNLLHQPGAVPEDFLFSDNPAAGVYNAATCLYSAAQLAAFLGFSEIYLLGVDHHFQVSRNDRGEIITDSFARDYFTDRYNPDRAQLYVPNLDRSTAAYLAMKAHLFRRNIRVCNATRGGKLEVFPRMEFDGLFDD